jgi:hypothetical protein
VCYHPGVRRPSPNRRPEVTVGGAVRAVAAGLAAAVGLGLGPGPATAQQPIEVRDGLDGSGVWMPPGAADRDALETSVGRARAEGVELVVVVAPDPQPDAQGFALRLRQLEGVGDPVLVIGPGTIGHSSEVVDRSELLRARAAALRAEATVEARVDAFVTELVTEPEAEVPELVGTLVRFLVIALLVLGAATVAEQALRLGRQNRRRRRAAERAGPP